MMYFRVNYRWADETVGHLRNDLQAKLAASGLIGALDTNVDGVVSADELRGRFGAMLKARFAQVDTNRDGVLEAAELNAAMPRRHRGRRASASPRAETPNL
jgi:hypothetical protein